MDSLAEAVQAADGPWPVLAIALIGVYALVWKYGRDLLLMARTAAEASTEAAEVAKAAHQESMDISESIVTNHGSKHLGDAVDRLTEWTIQHMIESRVDSKLLRDLRSDFVLHQLEEDTERSKVDSRLSKLEQKGK